MVVNMACLPNPESGDSVDMTLTFEKLKQQPF